MTSLQRLTRAIDALSRWCGALASAACLAMVLIGAFNALARYLARDLGFDLSSNSWIEAQWYLFSIVFLAGASATLLEDRHVRVDVLYGRLGPRGRAWIDLGGGLFLLLPFCAFSAYGTFLYARRSFDQLEQSSDPGGLARWPIKLLLFASFCLLFLQGVSFVLRQVEILRREPDATPPSLGEGSPS